jgi:hypothetical protein
MSYSTLGNGPNPALLAYLLVGYNLVDDTQNTNNLTKLACYTKLLLPHSFFPSWLPISLFVAVSYLLDPQEAAHLWLCRFVPSSNFKSAPVTRNFPSSQFKVG